MRRICVLAACLAACGADGPPIPPSQVPVIPPEAPAPPLPVDAVEDEDRVVDGLETVEFEDESELDRLGPPTDVRDLP